MSDLEAAGWIPVGPVWKHPDDDGPDGRKWSPTSAEEALVGMPTKTTTAKTAAKPRTKAKPPGK